MISIIVPVYNTGKYLKECLDSLIEQTYQDIEILLIDDGSTDNSRDICMEYEKKDSRVRMIHKENSGVSDARNLGLDIAKGEYISFCDSDDMVDQKLYTILLDTLEKYKVDRIVGGYSYLYNDGRTLYCKPRMNNGKYEAQDILSIMIDDGTMSGFLFSGVNNSLFKKQIIDKWNIRFNSNIKYNEDSLFSFQYMLHSCSIYSMQSKATYYYRQHTASVTKKRNVGDKYGPLRNKLYSMELDKMDIDFENQMKRRMVTEALWQIMDISTKRNGLEAIKDIRSIVQDDELQKSILCVSPRKLNRYKRYYYYLMKLKMPFLLFFSSSTLLPFLSKYISR